ncbi:MAG: response regulator [Chloroflexi bacterium]|nr:response regulator [Chloroflexota bacterium]MBU1748347.1 response regulator [Chloroflexota bacterium]
MTEKKTRVLIVDDDPSLCRTLALILAHKGHEVVTVEEGLQAVAAAQQQPFDLILIDVLLPGQSGLDTLRALKVADPQARMVMMTGYAGAGLVAEAAARVLAERIRRTVAGHEFAVNEQRFSLTVSLGIADSGPGEVTKDVLIDQVDRALYRAKLQGRNRVCADASPE